MRKLTDEEQEKIKLLTKNQVSLTLIEPTENGLKKSIMDATGSVRSYLKSENIHDYELQQQGTESKVVIPTIIHTGFEIIKSKASLYRPSTKKGDPRIWFYSLTKVANPNDIIAITFYNDSFQVFNLTTLDINVLINSAIINPFQELISAINFEESEISIELLNKLKIISKKGFVKSEVNVQYSLGSNNSISFSLSVINFKATD